MRAVFAAGLIAIPVAIPLAIAFSQGCLPDLEIASPGPTSVCGDGFIDPDAGEQCDPGPQPDAGDTGPLASACVHCKVGCVVGGYTTFEDPATQHCYFQPAQTATSADAVSDCEAWGAHVVRFVSETELAFVAPNAAFSPFWIGLGREAAGGWKPAEPSDEPGWAADCAGCFAQVDGGGVIPPDPSEVVPDGPCVIGAKDLTLSWTESQCSAKTKGFLRQTVCEREPLGSRARACGSDVCLSVAATEGARRYRVIGVAPEAGAAGTLDANGALLGCAALGGRLAVLGSREEREQLGYAIGAYFGGPVSVWIGLSDVDGTWAWDLPDAGGMSPPPWGITEPGTIDGSVGRAYLAVDATRLDSELAHAGNGTGEQHAALCQIP